MNTDVRKNISRAVLLILLIVAIGTLGFHLLLDGVTLLDAFYLTVITLSTVGYGDLSPHTNMDPDVNPYVVKFFAVFLILIGMSTFLYTVGVITEYLVSGEMRKENRKRRMRKLIRRMKQHFIVCGGGETGVHIMTEMLKTHRPFVLIEQSEKRIEELQVQFKDLVFVHGDAANDTLMLEAGLRRAVGVVSALPDEKDNLLITISLSQRKRDENLEFRVVAKVTHYEKAAPKLREAGADAVISPSYISSRRMLSEMFRPAVTTFLDRMLRDTRAVMRIEEVTVTPSSTLRGLSLKEAKIPQKIGLLVTAIRKQGSPDFLTNPPAGQRLEAGDTLISIGDIRQIVKLRAWAEGATQ